MPLLDNAEEEEEEEEEEVITVNYQVNHPNDEETSLEETRSELVLGKRD
jgi:hypothetical protein